MNNVKKIATMLTIATASLLSLPVLAVSDADITRDVKSALAKDANTSPTKIEVSTSKGIVYLKGNLQTEVEATAAVEDATAVNGVKDVDATKLYVKNSSQQYRDAYITAKVKGAYVREKVFGDKPIEVTGVKVDTNDGVVTLSGMVDSQELINNAVAVTKTVKGVKEVKSTLTVKTATQ